MDRTFVLSVGEGLHLRLGKDYIIYAGMPSEGVYSIAQKKAALYQGFAWNLFYPRSKSQIVVDGVTVYVENVTPDQIRLRIP